MLQAHGVRGLEVGQGVCEGFERATEAVVFGVVGGRLDAVAAADGGGAVGRVGLVGCEVDFSKESGRERRRGQ